jgi:hypothetical protein
LPPADAPTFTGSIASATSCYLKQKKRKRKLSEFFGREIQGYLRCAHFRIVDFWRSRNLEKMSAV